MFDVTIDGIKKRMKWDSRKWGTPFDQLKQTVERLEGDSRLRGCPTCGGAQGYVNIVGYYIGCPECGGRGVVRNRWWQFWVPLPPSFYEE